MRHAETVRAFGATRGRHGVSGQARALAVAGMGLGLLGALAALQPAAVLPLLVGSVIIVTFVLEPVASLPLLFVWLLGQNSLAAILESHGQQEAATWVRRSDELMVIVLTALCFAKQVGQNGRINVFGLGAPVLAIIAVAGLAAARVGHASWFVSALDVLLLLKGCLIYLVVSSILADWKEPSESPVRWLLGAGLVAALVASIEAIDPPGFRDFVGLPTAVYLRAGWSSLQGPFVHPGIFGWVMGVCAVAAIALGLQGNRRVWYLFPVFIAGILASGRRKPILGVFAATVVLLWMSARGAIRWKRLAVAAVATAAVMALFWPLLSDLMVTALKSYGGTTNPLEQARDAMYLASVSLAMDHLPLGVGPGLFGGYASRLYYSPLYDQLGLSTVWGLSRSNPSFLNDAFWPHVIGEFGLAGLAAYAWLLVRTSRRAFRAVRGVTRKHRLLGMVAVGVLIQALAESVASSSFEGSLQAFVVFGLLAAAASTQPPTNPLSEGPTLPSPADAEEAKHTST